jgi:glycosyltransferase involved in cell wall biosynthesis
MRVTILTQYYEPEIGAPQRRLSSLAEALVSSGNHVTILTAMPSYPTGRIYPGYGGLFSREYKRQIEIVRTFILPTQSTKLLSRLLNYFSFVFSSWLLGTFALRRSDYLLVESPPLFLGITAIWLSRIKKAKLIFNVSDLWPQSAVHIGVIRPNSLAYRVALRLEALCYRKAWLVTGQSRSIVENIRRRFRGISTLLLSNGADSRTFSPDRYTQEARSLLATRGEFAILYAGLHGLAQGLGQLLEAARVLRSEVGYRFVLIGDGPEKQNLSARAEKERLYNVAFLKPRPSDDMPPLLAAADLAIVPLARHIPGAVPSKLYEAMASGCPVVLVAEGEAADIVNETGSGLVVNPGDIGSLVDAIKYIREHPSELERMRVNARQAALSYFDRARISHFFAEYLAKHTSSDQTKAEKQEAVASCLSDAELNS